MLYGLQMPAWCQRLLSVYTPGEWLISVNEQFFKMFLVYQSVHSCPSDLNGWRTCEVYSSGDNDLTESDTQTKMR